MNKDTCVHYIEATGCCRAHKPNCAHHDDGVCRAIEGRLEERPPTQSYGIRAGRWSPARALRDGLSGGAGA